ncbi:MAG: M23 family metallopeptidase, partial [Acidimicrobiia bacterium]|nr:M23 family metallopeptidase [Acidimicrobiia bacterium]
MSTTANRVFVLLLVTLLLVVQPETGAAGNETLDAVGTSPSAVQPVEIRTIVFPVAGPSDYGDTFGACRDGCTRRHQGVDIFAPKLAPVIAATDGTIVAERRNATSKPGNKIVIEDADGWRYNYFHLNNDSPGTDNDANPQSWIIAPGLRAGDTVRAGDLIGYVGDSGNAEETDPHLHFEIKPPGRPPINPTPSVTAARGRNAVVSQVDFRATDAEASEWSGVVEDRYAWLLGRAPTDTELIEWSSRLALGQATEADLVGDLAMAAPHREPEGAALRAYISAFSRLPTASVLDLLAELYREGGSVASLAERIVGSVEYKTLNGTSTAAEIVELSDSDDVKLDTWHLVQVVRAYRAAAGRLPDGDELESWTQFLDDGGLMVDVVAAVLNGEGFEAAPRHAGVFDANDLGFRPGLSARQGPVDLDPAADGGGGLTFASGDP